MDITVAVTQLAMARDTSTVRAQGLTDIIAVRQTVEIPIIGLVETGHDGVYIIPSAAHVKTYIETRADVVAVDVALCERGAGEAFADAIAAIYDYFPQLAVMVGCVSLEDAKIVENAGADLIGITPAGYIPDSYAYPRPAIEGSDLHFIEALCLAVKVPAMVEG